ncbi:Mis12 protein-domain-containing protein [Amylocarpus encephaloides]|uniref:Mis12 protein-domain-containing protein n=1 Tax=Amylocarpus encephaloides TaxID=45428 RepID=A0A9P7YSY5_9HELO|nr:Mis12 protein-domain-containing protein [Amylocarpus encephaloides]
MTAAASSDVTLLTEHLTYRPAALIDDIVNSINILAFRATEAVEKGLLAADPADIGFRLPSSTRSLDPQEDLNEIREKAKLEIETGVHQLETLLEAKIDKNFDKLELYALRNILSVPGDVRQWIRLSHYEGLSFVLSEDDPNVETIMAQRKRLRETQKLHALLVAESARNEATIVSLKAMLGSTGEKEEEGEGMEKPYPTFEFLQDKGRLTGDKMKPVTTTTLFTLSQLSMLKARLSNLRERLDELKDGNGNDGLLGEEEKTWRKERLEFVEKETRKHLENVRGLELGEMGDLRDGEWQGEGRKVGKKEVEDLEGVVQMVAGGASGEPMHEGP